MENTILVTAKQAAKWIAEIIEDLDEPMSYDVAKEQLEIWATSYGNCPCKGCANEVVHPQGMDVVWDSIMLNSATVEILLKTRELKQLVY